MECDECGTGDAELTNVDHEVDGAETIPLCADCRDEFEDGGLVEDVSLVDQ